MNCLNSSKLIGSWSTLLCDGNNLPTLRMGWILEKIVIWKDSQLMSWFYERVEQYEYKLATAVLKWNMCVHWLLKSFLGSIVYSNAVIHGTINVHGSSGKEGSSQSKYFSAKGGWIFVNDLLFQATIHFHPQLNYLPKSIQSYPLKSLLIRYVSNRLDQIASK